MKNSFIKLILLALAICFLSSCALPHTKQKQDYGLLKSAVMFSSDKVIGEYGEEIPNSFDSNQYMQLVGDKIPQDYLHALEKYKLEVDPHGWYFLIRAYDDNIMVLFDYSCSSEVDGPVLEAPSTYDLTDLVIYDTCK